MKDQVNRMSYNEPSRSSSSCSMDSEASAGDVLQLSPTFQSLERYGCNYARKAPPASIDLHELVQGSLALQHSGVLSVSPLGPTGTCPFPCSLPNVSIALAQHRAGARSQVGVTLHCPVGSPAPVCCWRR